MSAPKPNKTMFTRFTSREDGSTSIEFVLWLPLLVFILLLVVQGSSLFLVQSNYWSVARDTARLVARHAMDANTAAAYAKERAKLMGEAPNVTVSISATAVDILISQEASRISKFNPLGLIPGFRINASVRQSMEPY